MRAAYDLFSRYGTRIAVASALLFLAALTGIADASLKYEYDRRQFFYLTNPEGPAGDYNAFRMNEHECRPGSPLAQSCAQALGTTSRE